MKIVYLHQYFNTPSMIGGTRSFEMARRFVSFGHEVHLITSWREPSACKKWFRTTEDGINVHWLPVQYSNEMTFASRIKAFFAFAFKSASRAAEIDADVVFATSTPLTIALPAVYASKKQKIPLVFEIRDLWPELPIAMGALRNPFTRFLARQLELYAYRNSSSIVALSPGMKNGVIRTGYLRERIAVIPNSSDVEMFQVDLNVGEQFRAKRNWLGDKPLLIYAGTFGLINGVGYMVDLAVELLKLNSDLKILLIGEGAEFDLILRDAKFRNVFNVNLFFESSLSKSEMPAALCAATVSSTLFIDLPEMRCNSANKFFDALAAGKPVLLNFGGWMHDLVETHGCGLAMWKQSIDIVAQELALKVHDTEWLKRASHSSLKLAEEYFNRDVLAKQLISVLEATVNGCPECAGRIATGDYI